MPLRAAQRDARRRTARWQAPAPGPALSGWEIWRQAITRVSRFLGDLPLRWDRQRILVIGHVATRWGLDHFIGGVPLEDLVEQDFAWQEGWEYRLS
jgi:2,3-bisphosphoglycerate-dependent phosphoglycerate mutase